MKKILALFLALTMILTAGLAFASTLELTPGTPTGCGAELFKAYFTVMTQNAGYAFSWDDNARSAGNSDIWYAVSEDGAMMVYIFCVDGNVSYVQGSGSLTVDLSDSESAEMFGQWLGAALSGSCLSIYIGEESPEDITEVATQFQNELTPLLYSVTSKLTSDEQLKNGVADVTTVLGYPAGLEISGDTDGSVVTLNMRIFVGSKDARIEVK